MKIAVPSRHGRLLALCGLSALLHLLCLELVARHAPAQPTPMPGDAGPLVLRLAPPHAAAANVIAAPPATPAARPAEDAAPAAPAPVAATRTASEPAAEPQPSPQPATPAAPGARPAEASASAAASPTQPAQSAPALTPSSTAGGSPAPGDAPFETLLHYRVRMPPAVRLDYTLTRRDAAGHAAPAQPAYLDWRSDGARYRLEMDGVLGRLSSSGIGGDEGILPQRFVERDDGRAQAGSVEPDAHRVVFADGAVAPDAPGLQDRASLLMQLAGIGLARPAQVSDEIEIVVAGQGQTRIERFQVMGQEPVDTGAGRLIAWRLAQRIAAGGARLEVWLAPDQGWLPVQLRVTQADGASATQVLARIGAAPAP